MDCLIWTNVVNRFSTKFLVLLTAAFKVNRTAQGDLRVCGATVCGIDTVGVFLITVIVHAV